MTSNTVQERVDRLRYQVSEACRRSGRDAEDVTIIAVTKGFGPEEVRAAIAAGITDIGENRVQEGVSKKAALGDVTGTIWHMIGHLQTNKVKSVLQTFDIIHSVDSLHLAQAISNRAPVEVPVFIEVNVADESTKSGIALHELPSFREQIAALPRLSVRGLMTVAPFGLPPSKLRPLFGRLRHEAEAIGLTQLSMGMSDDFEVAVEEGATHVRIGRSLFGERPR